MEQRQSSDTDPETARMRVLGFIALTLTMIVGLVTPYAVLYNTEEPPSIPPPGWTTRIELYLTGADFGSGGFHSRYVLYGLDHSASLLFWGLTLLASLQFLAQILGKNRFVLQLVILALTLVVWVFGSYSIYGLLSGWIVLPTPIAPVVAIITLPVVWTIARR